MKKTTLVLVTLITLISCAQGQVQGTIAPIQFQKVIDDKKALQLVDVRTLEEFKDGHIKGAIIIDYYKADFKIQLDRLDKSKPIAIYCTVGWRSGKALKMLKKLGFNEAYDLDGGIVLWQKKGLKLVKD